MHHSDNHSRRDFLASLVSVGLVGTSVLEAGFVRAALARAQSGGAANNLFDIEKVTEGVYAALARPAALINSNAAIFENANDLVVMDTHSKPSAAASLIAQIRKEITPKPVRYVVNSHFHWDHMQGNTAYRQSFPRADFVATTATRQLMSQEGMARVKASLAELPKGIEENRQNLAKARTAQEKSFYQKLVAEQEAYQKEAAKLSLELPTVTVDKTMILHDKAHSLHFAFCGRAHTAGDVVIFCPEKRVVATGDMIHGFLPYMADGYPREWPKTIDVVGGFAFNHIVPGHGPVHHDRIRINHMRNYIEELTARVAEGKKAGKRVPELQASITPASLRSLQTDNYAVLVQEALGKFRPSLVSRPSLDDGIKSNIQDIYNTLDRA